MIEPAASTARRRILEALYLRAGVRLPSLSAVLPDRVELDGAIAGLRAEGMVRTARGRVRLTRRGDRAAYALTCAGRQPLRALLRQAGIDRIEPGLLLDLGCGPGGYLPEEAALPGVEPIGLDLDEESLGQAREAAAPSRPPLVQGRAEQLPFADGCFTTVVCAVVLPYVRESRALAEAARVMAPSGRLILTAHGPGYYLDLVAGRGVPARRRLFGAVSLIGSLTARLGWRLRGARFQSARRLCRLLDEAGAEVSRCEPTGRRLGLPVGYRLVARRRPARRPEAAA